MMNWTDIWRGLEAALDAEPAEHQTRSHAFLVELERHGLTVLPLGARMAADLFGTGAVAKTADGYAVLDPAKLRIEVVK